MQGIDPQRNSTSPASETGANDRQPKSAPPPSRPAQTPNNSPQNSSAKPTLAQPESKADAKPKSSKKKTSKRPKSKRRRRKKAALPPIASKPNQPKPKMMPLPIPYTVGPDEPPVLSDHAKFGLGVVPKSSSRMDALPKFSSRPVSDIPIASWVEEETKGCDFNDTRLTKRYAVILNDMAGNYTSSIPAISLDPMNTAAAYSFVNNFKMTPQKILEPHYAAASRRIGEHKVVLICQDTTEIDVTRPKKQVSGSGPLGAQDTRWGFFSHVNLALTPDGLNLGAVHVDTWARDPENLNKTKAQRKKERDNKPFEEKESYRWAVGYQAACELAQTHPETTVVSISDSEADIFEYFLKTAEMQNSEQPTARFIVRAADDRLVQLCGPIELKESDDEKEWSNQSVKPMSELLNRARLVAQLEMDIREQNNQKAAIDKRKRKLPRAERTSKVEIRAATVIIQPPVTKPHLGVFRCNAVMVTETNPPEGQERIQWIMLTDLPIETKENVLNVVSHYEKRWQIEIFFKVLKSGCEIERSQLRTAHGFLNFLGLNIIRAWRVMHVMSSARTNPNVPCTEQFDDDAWKPIYAAATNQLPPEQPMTLRELVAMVGKLAGFYGGTTPKRNKRKERTPSMPGVQKIWEGLTIASQLTKLWRLMELHTKSLLSMIQELMDLFFKSWLPAQAAAA